MDKGIFVVSLDFELEWGVRDRPGASAYRPNLLGSRNAIPRLLDLFREFGIHATWATVGFLFFETREQLLAALPERRPQYRNSRFDPYLALDTLGEDEERDPLHFGASLLRRIQATPGQEIATHTFSHYYCLEDGQTPEDFRSDLRAARAAARRLGWELRSLVFPRNQFSQEYVEVCRELGIEAYRGNERSWLYAARSRDQESRLRRSLRLLDGYFDLTGNHCRRIAGGSAPVDIPSSRFLRPYSPALRAFEGLRLRRISRALDEAASTAACFHLWWHPHNFGRHTGENLSFLRRVLERFARLRDAGRLESMNMGEVAALVRTPAGVAG